MRFMTLTVFAFVAVAADGNVPGALLPRSAGRREFGNTFGSIVRRAGWLRSYSPKGDVKGDSLGSWLVQTPPDQRSGHAA